MIPPVPVTIVTGFLGAGKTTLVNRWLTAAPRGDVAVIVNELGDVGIDGALLAPRARAIVEIAGGCVCCVTHAELVRALDDLTRGDVRPARILVETSGAASPAGVLRAIARGGPRGAHALDGVVTVVDATRVDTLGAHDLAIEQVGFADIVVLSRADRGDLALARGHRGAQPRRRGRRRQPRRARGPVAADARRAPRRPARRPRARARGHHRAEPPRLRVGVAPPRRRPRR